jgi:peroxiredoxin
MFKYVSIITCLLLIALGSVAQAADAPNFKLEALDGDKYTLDELLEDNKLIVIDFWQVGCKPCNELLPYLQDYHNEYKDKGVEVVIISRDTALTLPMVEPFFVSNKYKFKVLLDKELEVSGDLGVKACPVTIMVNDEKEIVWQHNGYKKGQEKEIKEVIELYLAGKDVSDIKLEEGDTAG